jgi:hypothetical protein
MLRIRQSAAAGSTALVLSALLSTAGTAWAACPQTLCDCLGEAGGYRVVALEHVNAGVGMVRDIFYRFPIGTIILNGDVCSTTAVLGEPASDYTEIDGDLYALAGPGKIAIKARIFGPGAGETVGAETNATGGGSVIGPIAGAVDTTGTHPGIASCQQAMTDVISASQTLAGLTPTLFFGETQIYDGSDVEIEAGPGVNVISVGRIALKARQIGQEVDDSTLTINVGPTTEAVIINAASLGVGKNCALRISGDERKVLINLPGGGPPVQVQEDARVDATVLAPGRVIRVGSRTELNAALGRRVLLHGPFLAQSTDICG